MEAGCGGLQMGLRYREFVRSGRQQQQHQVQDRPFQLLVLALPHTQPRNTGSTSAFIQWAPFSVIAATHTIPTLQVPTFLAMYLAATSSQFMQAAIFAAVGLVAGGVSGFAQGCIFTFLTTLDAVSMASNRIGPLAMRGVGAVARMVGFILRKLFS